MIITGLGDHDALLLCRFKHRQGMDLLADFLPGQQTIGDLTKRLLNSALIVGHGDLFPGVRQIKIGRMTSACKNRKCDARGKCPRRRVGIKQSSELRTCGPKTSCQCNPRKKGGTCSADHGIGRLKALLSRQNIRSP